MSVESTRLFEMASNGDKVYDDWATTFVYNGDGTVNYQQKTDPGDAAKVYRQTFSYSSGSISAISAWVKQ